MTTPSNDLRGIALMVLATASFVTNDTMMKVVTFDLPPLEVLFLRGVFAVMWSLPMVLVFGHGRKLRLLLNRWVSLRNLFEIGAVVCFIIALANMPIADITAMGQTAPMFLLLGVAVFFGEKVGRLRMALIALGFVGALMIVQPTGAAFTPFALLGFGVALGTAARDLVVRKLHMDIPAMAVAFSTNVSVMLAAWIGTFFFEDWVMPQLSHLLLLCGAGLFLAIGHVLIFQAYRTGSTGAVAPFFYAFTVWALISGVIVFGTVPNLLAIGGILLIVASGITVVLLDRRRKRLLVTA